MLNIKTFQERVAHRLHRMSESHCQVNAILDVICEYAAGAPSLTLKHSPLYFSFSPSLNTFMFISMPCSTEVTERIVFCTAA